MLKTYKYPEFHYSRSEDQDAAPPAHHPVLIVGGGMVGLTMALELRLKGVPAIVLEQGETVSDGSRSICQAKRTLEIWDRQGAAAPMIEKGITWNIGRVRHQGNELYSFDLLPEQGHKIPAFVNLQQYWVEEYLIQRLSALGGEIRWRNKVMGVEPHGDGVTIEVDTPDGPYRLSCDYLIAADGARSQMRREMDLAFTGQVFNDKFLITDIEMKADFPSERWFWFDPEFNPGQSALLHRQADNVWRLDFQIGADADNEEEMKHENVIPRVKAMLGEETPFELEWISVYTFQCRRLEKFRHGSVFFIGDAAHQVSPFGARGGNGGVQDADNLGWKLDLVMRGLAPESLLGTYDEERIFAADENILNSTRSTDFLTPKTPVSRAFRDAVLSLAQDCPFARSLVNSGRLSVPATLSHSSLNTPDEEAFEGQMTPGAPAADAPLRHDGREGWLLDHLGGGFKGVFFGPRGAIPHHLDVGGVRIDILCVGDGGIEDVQGWIARRYDGRPGSFYLLRPDQHVAGRWRRFDEEKVKSALSRAVGKAS